ncbi:MAG: MotA/TolQ/ExbB proton channel family protein [Deltaproteobacteria bacterium]|nr:MotA/TolQ/ExbB proton channel family protein [Deltaproteobacteria bacterium]
MIDQLLGYLASGGAVSGPLVVIGLSLWALLTLRALDLRTGLRGELDQALARADQGDLPDGAGVIAEAIRLLDRPCARGACPALAGLAELEDGLGRGRRLIRALVAISPLLGLLGTVSGMIETFSSLGEMTLHAQSGGIAGGISVALVSTQLGLLVAIPGLLAGRMLDQREDGLRLGLDLVREHLRVRQGVTA